MHTGDDIVNHFKNPQVDTLKPKKTSCHIKHGLSPSLTGNKILLQILVTPLHTRDECMVRNIGSTN